MSTKHHDVSNLISYNALSKESLKWFRQTWGDALVVSWRGSDSSILAAHTLFANYDLRPKDGWGNSPAAPRLSWLSDDFAYIYISDGRLLSTLTFYFDVQLRYHRETGKANPAPRPVDSDDENEVTPDWDEWLHDEALCAKLAARCAQHFIEHHIIVRSFMPEAAQPLIAEHSIGRGDHAEFSYVEDLVDRTPAGL